MGAKDPAGHPGHWEESPIRVEILLFFQKDMWSVILERSEGSPMRAKIPHVVQKDGISLLNPFNSFERIGDNHGLDRIGFHLLSDLGNRVANYRVILVWITRSKHTGTF